MFSATYRYGKPVPGRSSDHPKGIVFSNHFCGHSGGQIVECLTCNRPMLAFAYSIGIDSQEHQTFRDYIHGPQRNLERRAYHCLYHPRISGLAGGDACITRHTWKNPFEPKRSYSIAIRRYRVYVAQAVTKRQTLDRSGYAKRPSTLVRSWVYLNIVDERILPICSGPLSCQVITGILKAIRINPSNSSYLLTATDLQ